MSRVVVVGSSNTDLVVKTERFPVPGETVLGGEFFMFPGGKGANQAVTAARMDSKTSFICAVGDDLFGRKALESYEQEGLDTGAVHQVSGVASGIALITVNAEGENEIVVASGANSHLSADFLRSQEDRLLEADIILTQLEIPMPAITYLAGFCRAENRLLILNPAPARDLPSELLDGLFAITPNQSEAELLTGIAVTDRASAQKAAEALLARGVRNAVITMGSKGAYYCGSDGTYTVSARKVTAVDTTAAGDVFNGVLASALASGLDWSGSLKRASSAAALSVTRMGAQGSAPYSHEI